MRNNLMRMIAVCLMLALVFTVTAVYGMDKNIRKAGIVDNLEDFSFMKTHTGLKLEKNTVGAADKSVGVAVYESFEEITEFHLYFTGDSQAISVQVSADGVKYRKSKMEQTAGCLSMTGMKGKNRFLKIELHPGAKLTGVEVNTKVRGTQTESGGNVIVDDFNDFSKMYSHDPGFATNNDKPEEHDGDPCRVVRGTAADGASIVYQTPEDIAAIKLKTFYGSARSAGTEPTLNYYLSPDGANWSSAEMTTTGMKGTGLSIELKEMLSGVPSGMRYFKIEYTGIDKNTVNWSPKLGRLELYYGNLTAPVTSFAATGNGSAGAKDPNAGMAKVTVPAPEEVIAAFKERRMEGVHPRLVATAEDFERIRLNLGQEPYSRWFESLKQTCEGYFKKEPIEFVDTDVEQEQKNFLTPIREIKARLENLSMLWKLTGEERYAERAYKELENAMNFPTLYPEHYLNVGEGVFAFAVAYDWLYDWMTPEQKRETEKGIRKQLDTGHQYMKNGGYFTNSVNNWNGVCCGGLTVGALAIMETDYAYCADFVNGAVRHTPKGIAEMAPAGVYPEGPGYWDFGTEYLVYMMSAMDHVLGQDYGLSQVDGFRQAGDFLLFIGSPSKNTFNFADSGEGAYDGPQAYWFAKKFNNPICAWYQRNIRQDGGTWDMIYYDPEYYTTPEEIDYPLDAYRPGAENFSIFRSSFEDKNGLYAALKGGDNQSSHGDLDIGTFVFDALGQRWASELGAEDYAVAGYWDPGRNGGRWNYYRKRAQGHNTLVINPDMEPDQDPMALDEITDFETVKGGGYTILDMTNAYAKNASEVRRGMMVFDSKQQMLIQDEVSCFDPSEIYWSMHTYADVEIAEDGKTATLTRNGEKCLVTLQTPAEARFETRAAEPMEGTPNPDGGARQPDVTVLSIHLTQTRDAMIRVIFTPLVTGVPDPQRVVPEVAALDEWFMEDMEKAELSGIIVDGEPLGNFSPDTYVYTVQVPDWVKTPLEADAVSESGTVEKDVHEGVIGQTVFRVKSPGGNVSPTSYAVRFVPMPVTAVPEDTPEYKPVQVTASDVPEPENTPENTLDGDYATRWAAEGDQWIQYDLGEIKDIGAMGLSFMGGSTRVNYFAIEISEDGKNWTEAWKGQTVGATDKLATYIFKNTARGRYIRFHGNGNSANAWNSITEAKIYGRIKQNKSFADISESWAKAEIEALFTAGLIEGATTIYYKPASEMTEDVFAAWLAKLCGMPAEQVFPDAAEGEKLNRQNAAVMTARAAKFCGIVLSLGNLSGFADLEEILPENREAVALNVGSGILKGTGTNAFEPNESLTREQAAVILYRIWQMQNL